MFPTRFFSLRYWARRFWPRPGGTPVTPGLPGGRWVVPGLGPQTEFAGTLYKRPADRLWLLFDFGNVPELAAGGSILTADVSVSPSGVTVAGVTASVYTVGAWYNNGAAVTTYLATCTATLDDGSILTPVGQLVIP